MAATGDMGNNLRKLLREVQRMKLKSELNINCISQGVVSAFLPLLHAAFMSYSLPLARHIAESGVELYGKNDLRFVEGLYKVMRDSLHYRPQLTKDQFLSKGFAERKIMMTYDLLKLCQSMHNQLQPHDTRKPKKTTHLYHSVPTVTDQVTVLRDLPINTLAMTDAGYRAPLRGNSPLLCENTLADNKLCSSHPLRLPFEAPPPENHPQLVESTELQLSPISSPLKSNVDTTNSPHHDVLVQVIREQASPVDKNEQGQKSISNWQQKQTTPDRPALRPNLGVDHSSVRTIRNQDTQDESKQVDRVHQQMSHLVELVERMSARLVLLETQVKLMEGSHLKPPERSQATVSTQTEDTAPHQDSSCTPHTSPEPAIAEQPFPKTPTRSPTNIATFSTSYTHTPEETRRMISRLHSRAEQTRQLLSRTSTSPK